MYKCRPELCVKYTVANCLMKKCIYLIVLLFLFDDDVNAQYVDSVKRYLDFYNNAVDKNSKDVYYYSVAKKPLTESGM